MFEKFTDRARKTVALANQAALKWHHEYIGTEHVLLGMLKEGTGVGAKVLNTLGLGLKTAEAQIEKLITIGPDSRTNYGKKLPQTPRFKMVIEYAISEAGNLQHNYVGTEHILLGLAAEKEGVAAVVLQTNGLTLERVRAEVLKILEERPGMESAPSEVVKVSFWQERIVGLLSQIVHVFAEETETSLLSTGRMPLHRIDLGKSIDPDTSFYTIHAAEMVKKNQIELPGDPPPDLSIEVACRSLLRRKIYQDIGIPELWIYDESGLTIWVLSDGRYDLAACSPTFPQLDAKELSELVAAGLVQDETVWTKAFRRRVREAIDGAKAKN